MAATNLIDDFTYFNLGQPEAEEDATQQEDEFDTKPAFRLGIVGIGQCGNNFAAEFYKIGYRKVLAINTAKTDLDSVNEPIEKLLIGHQGAGKNPEVGRECIEAKTTRIRTTMCRLFEGRVDKIVICMGLGGGTGSGGGPEVVKIAKDLIKEWRGDPEKDVIVIATLPEPTISGSRVCYNALLAYREIERLHVPRLYVDNGKMQDIIKTTIGNRWDRMNHWVVKTFHECNSYAAKTSEYGNFDGQDLNDLLRHGRFIFSAIPIPTLDDKFSIGDVIAQYLERSLFTKMNLKTAVAAGCIMILNKATVADRDPRDLNHALVELISMMQKGSTLHNGVYLETFPAKKGARTYDLICYVLLSGLGHPQETLELLFEKGKSSAPEEFGTLSAIIDA